MPDYRAILKQYWGYDSFRGIQEQIIESIGSGQDTLGLMPTGGGKSVTFQVPAMACEGVCLVVTPLIALMKDQVANLRARGIRAVAIYTGMSREEIVVALENCIFGDYKFLYVSPERLSSELFLAKLRRIRVSFITVDESHCISQWGYDFRPAYLRIADIRKLLPDVPVLALTATATPEVVKDIQEKLAFRRENVFGMSFERTNLAYVVRPTGDKTEELFHILSRMPGCAIVYTRNRKNTREVAGALNGRGVTAEYYHAGLPNVEKDERQRRWQRGEARVMVATNAFGMGIDKPDVRLVVHMDVPDSPEAYFQEAGRAGRDGMQAYAVLLTDRYDGMRLKQRVGNTFPEKSFVRQVYEELSYFYQVAMGSGGGVTHEFDLGKFCCAFKHYPVPTDSALRILTQAGYIEYVDEQENESRLMFTVRRDELYSLRDEEPGMDRVIRALLRTYTGLFTDYVYIDEHRLAHACGTDYHGVYETLRALDFRRVIHYIPRKRCSLIRYICNREEMERVVLSPEVYDLRRESYDKRVGVMLGYLDSADTCRSRMLLRYFGEDNGHDCGMCDVCKAEHPSGTKRATYHALRTLWAGMLAASEEGSVSVDECLERGAALCDDPHKLLSALTYMRNEELLGSDGDRIWKTKTEQNIPNHI